MNSKAIGIKAEQEAKEFLLNRGLTFIANNYNCKAGEIDLIMRDKTTYVFVEVRYRKKSKYGSGLESVTKSKQQKIIRAAKYYLLENQLFDKILCRFDVISSSDEDEEKLLWTKDAFWEGK